MIYSPHRSTKVPKFKTPENNTYHPPTKKESIIPKISYLLENYIKENTTYTVFIHILLLFKSRNYQTIEYYDLFRYLLNDFNKNKNTYMLRDQNAKVKDKIINKFLDEINFELKNNKALTVTNTEEQKIIKVDLKKAGEILLKYTKKKNVDKNGDISNDKFDKIEKIENKIRSKSKSKSLLNKKRSKTPAKEKKIKNIFISKESNVPNLDPNIYNNNIINSINSNANILLSENEDIPRIEVSNNYDNIVSISSKDKSNFIDLDTFTEDNIYENILKTNKNFLGKIQDIKLQLNDYSSTIKNMNDKLEELIRNISDYNNTKKLIEQSNLELSNIYHIVSCQLESLKIYTKISNYNGDVFLASKNTINCYHENYIKCVEKIKDFISNLKKYESDFSQNQKNIEAFLESVILLQNEIIDKININFKVLEGTKGKVLKSSYNYDNENDEVINGYLKRINILMNDLKKFEEISNGNNGAAKKDEKPEVNPQIQNINIFKVEEVDEKIKKVEFLEEEVIKLDSDHGDQGEQPEKGEHVEKGEHIEKGELVEKGDQKQNK